MRTYILDQAGTLIKNPAMKTGINVLHVIADPITGVLLVGPIACQQREIGYHVEFACGPGEYLEPLKEMGFEVTQTALSRKVISLSHVKAVFELSKLMRGKRIDIVHLHTPIAGFLGRIAAAMAGVKIVIYHMRTSWWDSPRMITRLLFTMFEKIAGIWTTHIFTINCSDANELVARGIVKSNQITCLHCGGGGVDIQRFNPLLYTVEKIALLRKEVRLNSSDFVIGYIGRIVEEKGLLDLLDAFKNLSMQFSDIKLIFVGGVLSSERDRDAAKKIENFIRNKGLTDRVIRMGFRSDIPSLISLMDIVVLPSYREGFGMVLAESAAMSKPVISTNTRGGREAVEQDRNGLLVPLKNPTSLENAILYLYEHPEVREQMGVEGRKIALQRFDNKLVFEKINHKYSELLGERL
jgi:glycosyltransferase involved in cell wall biosynthesis